jgi:hypothetical protein
MSNRTDINNYIVEQLKQIDGYSYLRNYKFKSDVHLNVYIGTKFLDEINDFPSIYSVSPEENRIYNTIGTSEAFVTTILKLYVYSDNSIEDLKNLIEDITQVIYSLTPPLDLQVKDITIKEINLDSGLLQPYGMAEIFLTTRFEI